LFVFGDIEHENTKHSAKGQGGRGGTSERQNRTLIFNFLCISYLQFDREKWRAEVPPLPVKKRH